MAVEVCVRGRGKRGRGTAEGGSGERRRRMSGREVVLRGEAEAAREARREAVWRKGGCGVGREGAERGRSGSGCVFSMMFSRKEAWKRPSNERNVIRIPRKE